MDIGNQNGKINDIALDADGKKLYVAVPFGGMFGTNGWARGQGVDGKIYVINVDQADAERAAAGESTTYLSVIGELNGHKDPYDIEATADANKLAFVSRGERREGLYFINVRDADPTNYDAWVEKLPSIPDQEQPNRFPLELNLRDIGVRYAGFVLPFPPILIDDYRKLTSQYYDLDIRNPVALEITPDMSYAFVADYDLSRYLTMGDSLIAYEIERRHQLGNNIGLIRNPFEMSKTEWDELNQARGVDFKYGLRGHVGSTSPIPDQYLTEIAMRPDGSQVLAHLRSSGAILTLNTDGIIKA
ncbi:hypothetical protein AB9K41_15240, partial [Cribrihabitans sp. XS_ASV171]